MNEIINNLLKNKISWSKEIENVNTLNETEFAEIRLQCFGASDSSKLLEINPFPNSTTKDLILEKASGKYDKTIGLKPSVRAGKELEPYILTKLETIYKNVDNNFVTIHKPTSMYIDEQSKLGVNFDGIMFINNDTKNGEIFELTDTDLTAVPVEVKCVLTGTKYYNWKKCCYRTRNGSTDQVEINPTYPKFDLSHIEDIKDRVEAYSEIYGIPAYYFTQLQQQLIPLNAEYGYLAVLNINEWEFYIFKVYAHKDIQDILIEKAKEAWPIVVAKKEIMESQLCNSMNLEQAQI